MRIKINRVERELRAHTRAYANELLFALCAYERIDSVDSADAGLPCANDSKYGMRRVVRAVDNFRRQWQEKAVALKLKVNIRLLIIALREVCKVGQAAGSAKSVSASH